MRWTARIALVLCGWSFGHVSLADEAQRWVTAGGALSEWVVALGGESRLVGVDTTSQHPDSLKKLPSIGYQRALSAEGILALAPQRLIGSEEMGPPTVLSQLRNAGVEVEVLSAAANLRSVQATVQRLGELLGDTAAANSAWQRFQGELARQRAWVAEVQRTQPAPEVLLLLGQAGNSPMIAGKDTSADWLLREAGGRNLATSSGYKAISVEALTALDPQVIVIADRALAGPAAREALLRQNPALAMTRAARAGRIAVIDPTLLVGGLGPRLPTALADLCAQFYPAAPVLPQQASANQ